TSTLFSTTSTQVGTTSALFGTTSTQVGTTSTQVGRECKSEGVSSLLGQPGKVAIGSPILWLGSIYFLTQWLTFRILPFATRARWFYVLLRDTLYILERVGKEVVRYTTLLHTARGDFIGSPAPP
ncbi:MAG: hypothetical protein JSS79_18185, partial [Bacteroidetes bacterium]|nr:hypothetical protein [Bacteroidota bacterium]